MTRLFLLFAAVLSWLSSASHAQECRTEPTRAASFGAPTIKWEWLGDPVARPFDQVMMTPAVAQLDDDNGDGLINENDVPDVLFTSFEDELWEDGGYLRAVDGATGQRKWPTEEPTFRLRSRPSVTVADVDADSPGPEILGCSQTGSVVLIAADGSLLEAFDVGTFRCSESDPILVADMDHDGVLEIAADQRIFHRDGTTVGTVGRSIQALYDVNLDGELEAVAGLAAFTLNGETVWDSPRTGQIGIADLDGDGDPDVVAFGRSDIQARDGTTGEVLWTQSGPVPNRGAGGSVSVADIDSDGRPEIAQLRNDGTALVVYEGESGEVKWEFPTNDLSARVGVTAADLNFDGAFEFIHRDERGMYIFNANGGVRFEVCSPSATLSERAAVADVDRDGAADILVAVNDYAPQAICNNGATRNGLQVWSNSGWSSVRSVWNQAEHHATNVCADGTIPTYEVNNASVFNHYNAQTGIVLHSDLRVSVLNVDTSNVPAEIEFTAVVTNEGEKPVNAGVRVAFFDGEVGDTSTLIGVAVTEEAVRPGDMVEVELDWEDPPPITDEGQSVWVSVDDDGAGLGVHAECNETNNTDSATYTSALDSDEDGIPSVDECGGTTSGCFSVDYDGDGTPDFMDVDDDNDGVLTRDEVRLGAVGDAPGDIDNDGVPNHYDLDSDNDGIPDLWESGFSNEDQDKNGIVDRGPIDDDGDGLLLEFDPNDNDPTAFGQEQMPLDTDGDGTPDLADLDADGDLIDDIIEARGIDDDDNGRLDGAFSDPNGNGYSAVVDPDDGGTPWEIPDLDLDAMFDFQDLDSDGDSTPDMQERTDNDQNGVLDAFEFASTRGGLAGGSFGCAVNWGLPMNGASWMIVVAVVAWLRRRR